MPRVRFKRVFRYSPDGRTTVTAHAGSEHEVSEEIAKSVLKSGVGELVTDDQPEKVSQEVPVVAPDAQESTESPERNQDAPEGDGKTGPVENKSMSPDENKEHELLWEKASKHFRAVKEQYEALPPESGTPALTLVFAPLQKRFDNGERTQDLLDNMMSAE